MGKDIKNSDGKEKENVKILRKALEDILKVTKLDRAGRRAFVEKRGLRESEFWSCAVGYIEAVAFHALEQIEQGDSNG